MQTETTTNNEQNERRQAMFSRRQIREMLIAAGLNPDAVAELRYAPRLGRPPARGEKASKQKARKKAMQLERYRRWIERLKQSDEGRAYLEARKENYKQWRKEVNRISFDK